jgi:hypothetical protein
MKELLFVLCAAAVAAYTALEPIYRLVLECLATLQSVTF